MRLFFLLAFLVSGKITVFSHENHLPREFSVKYNSLQSKAIFVLESLKEKPFAKVFREEKEEVFSLSYRTISNVLVATAQGVCNSTSAKLEVFDQNHNKLGEVVRKKHIISPASYQISNSEKKVIAEGSMNWLGSRFLLCDPKNSHKEYATFYRPYFRLPGDHWYVQINHEGFLDQRLIVITATLQAYIDRKNCELSSEH